MARVTGEGAGISGPDPSRPDGSSVVDRRYTGYSPATRSGGRALRPSGQRFLAGRVILSTGAIP